MSIVSLSLLQTINGQTVAMDGGGGGSCNGAAAQPQAQRQSQAQAQSESVRAVSFANWGLRSVDALVAFLAAHHPCVGDLDLRGNPRLAGR
jgi:hypothetical protein